MSYEAWGEPDDQQELPDGWLDEDQANELRDALDKSVRLQSHYAELLNSYDGGNRIIFTDTESWLERLRKLNKDY